MNVYVKPHPAMAHFPADRHWLSWFRSSLSEEVANRMVWLPDNFSVNAVARMDSPLVISPRGSVLAEAAWAGLPAVNLIDSIYNRMGISIKVNAHTVSKSDLLGIAASWRSEAPRGAALRLETALLALNRLKDPYSFDHRPLLGSRRAYRAPRPVDFWRPSPPR